MPNKQTIILIARRLKLVEFFKEIAKDLSNDFKVIVFVEEGELKFWRDVKGIEVKNSDREFKAAVDSAHCDLQNLAHQIEEELGLSIFKAASNFILYRKFTKRSHSRWRMPVIDDEERLLRNYLGSYLVFSRIFEKETPTLIFYETPELVSARVLAALAYKNNIFSLGFKFAPHTWDGQPRAWLSFGWREKNILLEHYYANKQLIKQESYINGQKLIQRIKEKYTYPLHHQAFIKEAQGFSNWKKSVFLIFSKLSYGFLTLQPKKYIRIINNIFWINRHFHCDLPKCPFIAFFLQNQPEASTSSQIPRWINQDTVMEQLAINAPYGLKILVKENARNLGYRGRDYFGDFLNLHNIYLCHPAVDSHSIISKAEALLTLTGTVGFEGVLLGKKVAVLGRPYYSIFEGVRKLNYPEEIFDAMRDSSWQPQELREARDVFAAAYSQSLCDFKYNKIENPWSMIQGGDRLARAIRDFLDKRDKYGLTPGMFDKGY